MTSEISYNYSEFNNQNWKKLLKCGGLEGRQVEIMAKALEGKTINDLQYDHINKIITCGPHSLDLKNIVNLKGKENYNVTNSNLIEHLAEVIVLKIEEASSNLVDQTGWTPLTAAVYYGDLNKIDELIQKKADLNLLNALGNTPLTQAVLTGNLILVEKLIASGADVNLKNGFGNSPLMIAANWNNIALEDLLLQNGAKFESHINAVNANGWTPLTTAVYAGNLNKVDLLLQQGANVNAPDRSNTPLTQAVLSGNLALVEKLIARGADVNLQNLFGNTALTLAIRSNNKPLVDLLLQKGANPNIRDDLGSTPIHYALSNRDFNLFEKLIQNGADLNLADNAGSVLLSYAMNDFQFFKKLIDSGADPAKIDKHGRSVLDMIKLYRPKDYRAMIDLIYEKNPELKLRHKEFKYRKQLAHAWHLKGETVLKAEDNPISLEGGNTLIWFHQMDKNFEEFQKLCPEFPNQELFADAIKFTAKINTHTSDQILTRIQSGLPTFFNVGFLGHDVVALFWKNQFVLCNRGDETRRPLEVYHYNESLLTTEMIDKIRGATRGNSENYRKLFFEELPSKLEFSTHPQDLNMEAEGAKLYNQVVGNCGWVSSTTSIYAFQMLSGDEIELEKQRNDYKTWLAFQQLYSLERTIRLIGTSNFAPDHGLIQKGISMALFPCYNLPLTRKLDDLIDAYTKTLPAEALSRFQNDLNFWRDTASAYHISQRQIVL